MNGIKVLDCTFRDGGYVNNWEFGQENIEQILHNLVNSKLDYIELGYLKSVEYDRNKTIFSSIEDIKKICETYSEQEFCVMINYGDFQIEDLPQNNIKNLNIRLAFKKKDINSAIEDGYNLKNKGYKIFINPMVTDSYADDELIKLITEVNKIQPVALTIVDTLGEMVEENIEKLYQIIEKNLDKNIALCFHSHNNMQKSFANTQYLIDLCKTHNLVIDASVFGMGRGAGNLCTELITQDINKNYYTKYDASKIIEIGKTYIMPIYEKKPWGCSAEYYLAALNHCHPDYAKYLKDKQLSGETISQILQSIPEEKKANFSLEFIIDFFKDTKM